MRTPQTILTEAHIKQLEILFGNDAVTLQSIFAEAPSYDTSKDIYEFEFRFMDSSGHTPLKLFTEFQKNEHLREIQYSDVLVNTHKSSIGTTGVVYRSYQRIDGAKPFKYETKEVLKRIKPSVTPAMSSDIVPISVKLSKESTTMPHTLPIDNTQRRLRISYRYGDLPWSFDFTVRYIGAASKLVELKLGRNHVLSPSGYSMIDFEIEYLGETFKSLGADFMHLLSIIYMPHHEFDSVYQDVARIINFKEIPQVSLFTNRVMQERDEKDFVWLEKTDGYRYMVVFFRGKAYRRSGKSFEEIAGIQISETSTTIMDTELYDGKYYVFDVVFVGDRDVSSESYLVRMKTGHDWLRAHSEYGKFISMKKVYNLRAYDALILHVNTVHISESTGHKIDGVIVQERNAPYFSKNPICYKLKPARMNTMDAELMWVERFRMYYVYLRGRAIDLIYNVRLQPKTDKIVTEHYKYDPRNVGWSQSVNILFASPFIEGMHKFVPTKNWDTSGYHADQISEINEILDDMLAAPKKFNGAVVELSWSNSGWVPMRIRVDKQFPNGYHVGISNSSVLFSPINADNGRYFHSHKKLAFDDTIIDTFHRANQAIRTYIFDSTLYNPSRNNMTVVDIAGGRGADMIHLYRGGCRNFFAIDADKEALVSYAMRAQRITQARAVSHVITKVVEAKHTRPITFNAIGGYLSKNNSAIMHDLYSRYEFKIKNTDLIVINYAIHYLCDSYPALLELKHNLNSILNADGMCIITYFDGNAILSKMQDGAVQYKTFTIKTHKPIINQTKSKHFNPHQLASINELTGATIDGSDDILLESNDESAIIDLVNSRCERKNNVLITSTIGFNMDLIRTELKDHIHIVSLENIYAYAIFKRYYTRNDISFLIQQLKMVIDDKYTMNPWAMMPLPTIDESGYREEPLVLNKYIDLFADTFEVTRATYPMAESDVLDFMHNERIPIDLVGDYLSNIRMIILKRK